MSVYDDYLEKLKERGKNNRIVKRYQLIGLMIAEMLNDKEHKSLYIKLAKEKDEQELLSLAKKVAEMKNIERKGAYFMRVLFGEKKISQEKTKKTKTNKEKNNNKKTKK
jgi:hypothetical protein